MTTHVAGLIQRARAVNIEFAESAGGWILIADDGTSPDLLERLRDDRKEVIPVMSAGGSLRAARGEVCRFSGAIRAGDALDAPASLSVLLTSIAGRDIKSEASLSPHHTTASRMSNPI